MRDTNGVAVELPPSCCLVPRKDVPSVKLVRWDFRVGLSYIAPLMDLLGNALTFKGADIQQGH